MLQARWRPRAPLSRGVVALRARPRALRLLRRAAVRTPDSGAPLSLSDIITFESDLPRFAAPAKEADADELVGRASRVLAEVGALVAEESQQQQQQPQAPGRRGGGAATATTTLPRPGGGSAPPSSPGAAPLTGDELSRAIFGGSAQVSELEASFTRQALQRTLESGPPPSTAAPPSTSASASAAAAGAADGVAAERPAWAAALFASSASATSTSAPAAAPTATTDGAPPAPGASATTPAPGRSTSERSSGGASARPASASASAPSTSPSTSPRAAGSKPAASAKLPPPPAASRPEPPPPPAMQKQPARRLAAWAPLAFAEEDLSLPTELLLKSEESIIADAARAAVLPPLQSVVDLTAAARPPSRGLDLDGAAPEAVAAGVAVSEAEVAQEGALGRRLADGVGRLADGTRFEKLSGTDYGADGYAKKWEVLRGVTGDGTVQWEECWWTASNRFGLREMGAFKKGTSETGAAWVEEWKEVLHTHSTNLRLVIERTAHKWARDENADEWEEKWGECFEEAGRVHKYADKWAKAGVNVWHERWGEDYDGRGACQKWTDKWAERLLPGGGQEQWGDKWTETFGAGKGTKHGEVWSGNSSGERYNRWWNEEHFGDGRVRRWGNSTSGEYWDAVEHMDTYYNPVPHFGFSHAVGHSPQLWAVPLPPPDEGNGGSGSDEDGLGEGVGRL